MYRRRRIAPHEVLVHRHAVQVLDLDTAGVAAKVINGHVPRDLPPFDLPNDTMDILLVSLNGIERISGSGVPSVPLLTRDIKPIGDRH